MLQDISDCEFRRPSGRGGTFGRLCGAGKRGQEGGADHCAAASSTTSGVVAVLPSTPTVASQWNFTGKPSGSL